MPAKDRTNMVQAILSPETKAKMEDILAYRRDTGLGPFYSQTQLIRDLIIESHRTLVKKLSHNSKN